MIEQMTLTEIIARRARDDGISSAAELAEATGLSIQHARLMLSGYHTIGIKTHRALVKALDLDPGVIERSVRRNA